MRARRRHKRCAGGRGNRRQAAGQECVVFGGVEQIVADGESPRNTARRADGLLNEALVDAAVGKILGGGEISDHVCLGNVPQIDLERRVGLEAANEELEAPPGGPRT